MSVIVTKGLPCLATLQAEGLRAVDTCPAGVRPLRVLLLNLMPQKEEAELEYYRMLAKADDWVEIILVKMTGLSYHHTPQQYVDTYYKDIAELMTCRRTAQGYAFDGLIITGAPVEQMPFEAVRYWPQLLQVYAWAAEHVGATLHICWGAQAGLYALFGVPKYDLPTKKFGIFEQTVLCPDDPLMAGLSPRFNMPHSRHTEIRMADIARHAALQVLSASEQAGPTIIQSDGGRQVFVTGHLEYMPGRLDFEYWRDVKKNLPIDLPVNYYRNDDPRQPVVDSWRDKAERFYANWLALCRSIGAGM